MMVSWSLKWNVWPEVTLPIRDVWPRAFKFSNTLIITPSKTYDPNNEFDEEYFEFGLFMSRREYKTIRRRLVAGSDASRREGKYTGNVPPYGYARKKLKKEKGWTLEIIPDQAQVVRMIFDWYRNGMQASRLATQPSPMS